MNAANFRKLYEYHFTLNRRIWDRSVMMLSDEQFVQDLSYSVGSIRNQTVHVMSVDQRWFCGLRGVEVPDFLDPSAFPDRPAVRGQWDTVETEMRSFLSDLTDDRLSEAFAERMQVWEVLFHVLNHGSDHRAQMLAMLDQLGAPTFPQDYAHFAFGMDSA